VLSVHIGHLEVEQQSLRRPPVVGRHGLVGRVEQRQFVVWRLRATQAHVPVRRERGLETEPGGVELGRLGEPVGADHRIEAGRDGRRHSVLRCDRVTYQRYVNHRRIHTDGMSTRGGGREVTPRPGSKAAQREATRTALVTEARQRFARQGYAAVGLAEIVAAAGVTKGALYHHFGSKAALFQAVVQQVQQEVADRVAAAAEAHARPWDQLVAGCEAFLAASTDPDVQRIMLIDAPAVLGWHEWRAMDEAASGRLLMDVLRVLIADGTFVPQPVEPLARLLSGAMNEAALWLAANSARPDDLAATTTALRRLLSSQLRPR